MNEPLRPPVISEISTRDGTLKHDALHVNAIVDKNANGLIARKRPGFTVTQTTNEPAQGIHHDKIYRYDIRDDTLYVLLSNDSIYTQQALTFSSGSYTFADSGNLAALPFTTFHGITNKVVYKWRSDDVLTYTTITDAVSFLVYGYVQLNGAFYVMDASGNIWGSNILDPGTWDSLNKIVAPLEDGTAVAIAKHYNHIVAFGSTTMSLFADAGNPTGSPLQQATNYFKRVGCYSAQTIASVNDELTFVSKTDTGYLKVMRMAALESVEISNPTICKMLNHEDFTVAVVAYCLNLTDRYLYCVQLNRNDGTGKITLSYDSRMGIWYYWQFSTTTSGFGQHLSSAIFTQSETDSCTYTTAFTNNLDVNGHMFVSIEPVGGDKIYVPVSSLENNLLTVRFPFGINDNQYPDTFTAEVFFYSSLASPEIYGWSRDTVQMDDSAIMKLNFDNIDKYVEGDSTVTSPIIFKTRSDDGDYGSLDLKTLENVDILADMGDGGVYFRESLNDYQSYTPYRFSSLQSRVRLTDLGSFQRMSFEVCTLDEYPFRLKRIDLKVKVNG